MKRFHVNVRVKDIAKSVAFYNAIFNATPTVQKEDYAKWMLEDPRVNFAISLQKENFGVEHLGIQAETEDELQEVYGHLKNAKAAIQEEGKCSCCYAKSEKAWISDPQGVNWEAFYTYGSTTLYGEGIHNRNQLRFQKAVSAYEKAIANKLLIQNKLSVDDFNESAELYLLSEKGKVVGTGALEYYGEVALLRSISTTKDVRGKGFGKRIVNELEQLAQQKDKKAIYLLTNTAAPFFAKNGYSVIEREKVEGAILQSGQFAFSCPATSTIMKKEIKTKLLQ